MIQTIAKHFMAQLTLNEKILTATELLQDTKLVAQLESILFVRDNTFKCYTLSNLKSGAFLSIYFNLEIFAKISGKEIKEKFYGTETLAKYVSELLNENANLFYV